MNLGTLDELHAAMGAEFTEVNHAAVVNHYGDAGAEYRALREAAGVVDLGFRGRICLTGADRVRLLHGQVTNDVQRLTTGTGCYAALVNNKGRMQGDAFVYALEQELLLDFEPGLTAAFIQRLEHYVVADDVQIIDVTPYYGLISLQGPRSADVLAKWSSGIAPPLVPLAFVKETWAEVGEVYLMNQPRFGLPGYDLFVPSDAVPVAFEKLANMVREIGGRPGGWRACEWARIQAGIPRFGIDMTEANLPPEAGITPRAISYDKGCYIGQEVLARLRTYGQVTKALRGLVVAPASPTPSPADKLWRNEKEVGYVTSVATPPQSPTIALGYVRRECFEPGTELEIRTAHGPAAARIVPLRFAG